MLRSTSELRPDQQCPGAGVREKTTSVRIRAAGNLLSRRNICPRRTERAGKCPAHSPVHSKCTFAISALSGPLGNSLQDPPTGGWLGSRSMEAKPSSPVVRSVMWRVKVYPSPSFSAPCLKTRFIPVSPVDVVLLSSTRDLFLKLCAAHLCGDEEGKDRRGFV